MLAIDTRRHFRHYAAVADTPSCCHCRHMPLPADAGYAPLRDADAAKDYAATMP